MLILYTVTCLDWSHPCQPSSSSKLASYSVPAVLFYMVSLVSVLFVLEILSPINSPHIFLWTSQLYTKDASRTWKLVGSDGNQLMIKEPSANHLDDISKWVQYTVISVLILKNFHVLRVNWCWLKMWCTGIGWTRSCSSKLGIAVGIIQYCNGFSTLFPILGIRGQGMTDQRYQMDWSEAPWFLVCDNVSRCEKLDISRLLVL